MHHFRPLLLFITLLVCGAALNTVSAQNNSYGIDDRCYELYDKADLALGTPEADTCIEQLVEEALRAGDTKAQVLGSVLQLRQQLTGTDFDAVRDSFMNTLDIAERTGYLQYYFYAYNILAIYHFNRGQKISSLELVRQMQEDATRMDSQYGRWNCSKFMGQIYLSTMHFDMAQEFFAEAINIYRNSDDSLVTSQSLASVYTDLSETLDYRTPEFEQCLLDAQNSVKTSFDSLRVDYLCARDLATRLDYSGFSGLQAKCLSNPHFDRMFPEGRQLLTMTEAAFKGHWNAVDSYLDSLGSYSGNKYIASLSTVLSNIRITSRAQKNMLSIILKEDGERYNTVLSEVAARMDNDDLKEQLLEKTTSLNRLLRVSFILFFVLLAVFLVLTGLYIHHLRREKMHSEQSNIAKTKFVQNMSHEIRTPLNAIVGFSQLLALPDGMLTDAERTQYSSYIKNSSSLLTMLIDDILDISDVDSGKYKISLARCQCNEICRRAMSSVGYRVPGGVAYTFHSELPDDFSIVSDERRIEQVVTNFLTNACKHTAEGGISVCSELVDNDTKLRISVTDTGTGIPPDKAGEIFQRFAKLDRYKQGSGLGLNICRVIAKNLNGRVYLDTGYGRCSGKSETGSRFVFEIDLNVES